jgi:hypothetical protein
VEVIVGVGGKWTWGDSNIEEDDANGNGDGEHGRSPPAQPFKAGRKGIAVLHCANRIKGSIGTTLSPK